MKELKIDYGLFIPAIARDTDFHNDWEGDTYLDIKDGSCLWVFDDNDQAEQMGCSSEDNERQQRLIEARPDTFVIIPGLSHGEHHEMLKDFLSSEWTDDAEARGEAQFAYEGSIGRWKGRASDAAIAAFERFKEAFVMDKAEIFLLEHNIEPIW